jgi:hypothetical protein
MWCTKQPTLKFIPMHAAQYQHCILKHLLASDRSAVAVSFALVPSSRSHICGAQPPCHHIPLRHKPAIDPSRQFLHPNPLRVPLCLPCIRRSGVLLPPIPSSLVPLLFYHFPLAFCILALLSLLLPRFNSAIWPHCTRVPSPSPLPSPPLPFVSSLRPTRLHIISHPHPTTQHRKMGSRSGPSA